MMCFLAVLPDREVLSILKMSVLMVDYEVF